MYRRDFLALSLGTTGSLLAGGTNVSGDILQAESSEELPARLSGRYPHLTMFNHQNECGIGAVVPWGGRLWAVTYSPHAPEGSDDKLYEIDEEMQIVARPESVGGTPANRMIHLESDQLIIGPYFIDEDRHVRVVPPSEMFGRLTATARHLTDPENKVYTYDMEGLLYEVDVHSLEVKRLFARVVPGWHGKGAYTGQGRLVVANNGESPAGSVNHLKPFDYAIAPERTNDEDAGILAEWDGENWDLVCRRQFTEVTGPGGINGSPADDSPLWSIGWDKRSILLMVREKEGDKWHKYRLPKGCYSYDGSHGWHTEWPRIREVVPTTGDEPARLLMNMHGQFFDFPINFSPTEAKGIAPLSTYLKIVADFCPWNDEIVMACDDVSKFNNPLANQSQSNLWFTSWKNLKELGQPAGWGGVWLHDEVKKGLPSSPFLFAGYAQRCLHLAQGKEENLRLQIQLADNGAGPWEDYQEVSLQAEGQTTIIFDDALQGEWIRLVAGHDTSDLTAYFHYGPRGRRTDDASMFDGLARCDEGTAYSGGVIRPRGGDLGTLQFLASQIDKGDVVGEPLYYELDETLQLEALPEKKEETTFLATNGSVRSTGYTVDDASIILTLRSGERLRLPKGVTENFTSWPGGGIRGMRELVTERSILHAGGTFFVVPREISGGMRRLAPICTHDRCITDFCTWRGLLVLAGCLTEAPENRHLIQSDDEKTGLWLGDIDDLWKLGKPIGEGGPWRDSAVEAGEPSNAYLMTGYDEKQVDLSHDSEASITFTLEIDFLADGSWHEWTTMEANPGKITTYRFPDGFQSHWVRVKADKKCVATAWFIYR